MNELLEILEEIYKETKFLDELFDKEADITSNEIIKKNKMINKKDKELKDDINFYN